MKFWAVPVFVFLLSCSSEPDEGPATATSNQTGTPDSQRVSAPDREINVSKDTVSHASFVAPPEVKRPSGIYQFVLPYDAETKILHTVAFYSGTFRLQEEYLNKPDSVALTEGTWAPSQGYIWLYKDQLARGRYLWQGDTLQYFSPRLNKKFSLTKLTPASANPTWQTKRKEGALLYGVGTEPFWSVELTKQDSIVLSMPDWTAPLRVKFSEAAKDGRNFVYASPADSLQVTVTPYFCSDGMSDFAYTNRVVINYRGKIYKGCGVVF